MLVTEDTAATGMQAFHHTSNSAAAAAAGCFYKQKLVNELRTPHIKSDRSSAIDDLWPSKYYGAPASALPSHPFPHVDYTKQYHSIPPQEPNKMVYHANSHIHSYHQPVKQAPYYHHHHHHHPSISTGTCSSQAVASNAVLQWQHSLQQQTTNHQLQQRLSQHQHNCHTNQDEVIPTSSANNRLADMFIRNHSHQPNYLFSLNDNPTTWYPSSSTNKDNLPQSPVSKNICPMCGKNYARPSTLKTHMRIHSGERPFRCKVCNKSFSQAANLTAHLRVHSGEKPFSCQVCNKTFSQSSSVTTHMRTHSGDRPYKCPVCRKGFSDSSTLTKHLRIHSGEKPYQCNFCSMSFSQSGNLNRHMKVHEQLHKPESISNASSTSPRNSPN